VKWVDDQITAYEKWQQEDDPTGNPTNPWLAAVQQGIQEGQREQEQEEQGAGGESPQFCELHSCEMSTNSLQYSDNINNINKKRAPDCADEEEEEDEEGDDNCSLLNLEPMSGVDGGDPDEG
jgi:hypothetical protein